ncbi:Clp protease N-terminal domain-containing protein [Amycolatopsis sp. NBC_01480]|uniref:Clp protease N-terminal domain-containing protein n=1 Tax=Amycolatopsis sp. NBC_01480 TaxID=2903562 RepID=UPI002E2AFB5C|nr:Clp protease N-terminal domain-containing protein [Amycolatopsis sp. NBC_01480]
MMFELFTPEARTVVVQAQQHAGRLGHRYVGPEHLLLSVASAGGPVGVVLRDNGITPDRVEEEIVRRGGLGGGTGLFSDLDQDALAAIGIDLDAVRARIEAAFSPEVLTRAAETLHPQPRPSRLNPRRAIPPGLRRWAQRRRLALTAHRGRALPAPIPPATGRYHAPGAATRTHLPFTTRAKKCLELTVREAKARHEQHIGVEHLVLGLIRTNGGLVPSVLLALGTSGPLLRTAILDRYRQAG